MTPPDGNKTSGNELRPIRGAPNYEEISKIKSSLSPRAHNYEEIARGKSPSGPPRSPIYDEIAKPKTPTSSPLLPNLTGKTPLPAIVTVSKPMSNLPDNVSTQKRKSLPDD